MFTKNKTAVALGTFDGLHIAHMKVLKNALNNTYGFSPVCVTFAVPPKASISGDDACLLMDVSEKTDALKQMGFSSVEMLDFFEVRNVSPEDFLYSIYEKYNVGLFCCGYNYHFGYGGKGDTDLLCDFAKSVGATVVIEPPVELFGETVSSSVIREHLKNGELVTANKMLGRELSFVSKVIEGDKRGREMGYPTLNQFLPKRFTALKFGVYASRVTVDNKEYTALTNIGIRPTYPVDTPLCETYIIDFNGDVYGKNMKVSLTDYLRPEKKFTSLCELREAITRDVMTVKGGIHNEINL